MQWAVKRKDMPTLWRLGRATAKKFAQDHAVATVRARSIRTALEQPGPHCGNGANRNKNSAVRVGVIDGGANG